MRAYRQMGVKEGIAYAWSRSRKGGWAIAQSPIMRTTVTLKRLKRAGYISFSDTYQSVSPIFENRLIPVGTLLRQQYRCERCTGGVLLRQPSTRCVPCMCSSAQTAS